MRKLILTCDHCSQRMQVPRSAIGRMGMCPTCGTTIKIRSTNTETAPMPKGAMLAGSRSSWWRGSGAQPTEDAKRKFGEAVDLYYTGRFAESLAIFDALIQQFPSNPDIENGRQQCLNALKRGNRTFALEDKTGGVGGTVGAAGAMYASGELDEQTVRRIVLDKMLRGQSEAVQLEAADMAARLLGLYEKGLSPTAPESPSDHEETSDDSDEDGESPASTNGKASNGQVTVEVDEADDDADAPAKSRSIYEI